MVKKQQREDLTVMLQKDNKKKHDARIKRKMIVNMHKQNVDYKFLQMSSHRQSDRPRTPDPDEEWKKREWGQAMATWRRELRQWRGDAGSEEERIEDTNTDGDSHVKQGALRGEVSKQL